MKRVYFTLTLMSLFGGLNAFAQTYTTINGVKYGLMQDNETCIVIGDDGATGDITFENEVTINGGKHTVTGVCGSWDYSDQVIGQTKGFSGNVNITSITFASGSQITWIGDHAFKNCEGLKTINGVPDGLNTIKDWCFEGTGLEHVDLSNTAITIINEGAFYNNKSLTSVNLPNGLKEFKNKAFQGCTSLNDIVMPSKVDTICNYVFEGCTSLSNVTLNEGCKTLGDHVFKNCPLTSFTFPSTLSSIKEYAFEGSRLTSADLSKTTLLYLPNGCFYNCKYLKEVKLPLNLTTPNSGDWMEAYDNMYGKHAFEKTAIESIDLTNTQLISLGDYMFADCQKLMTVKLPSTLKYIWNHAFCNSSLSSITFPRSLQKIDAWAFQNTQLTNVVIPTQCSSIEQGAFIDNANLTTVVINGLKCYLAYQAFCNCSKLTDVYITSKEAPVVERYGFPFNKDLKVHVMKDFVDIFYGLKTSETYNPCNATSFDSNLSLTLGKEWTTFTSAYNLDFSNVEGGLTAYTAKYNKDNDAVALTPVKKVAAHTGLILNGEAGKTYTVSILASNADGLEAVTDNQLVDCVDAVWSTGRKNDYFLSNGKFVKSDNDGWALPGKSFLYIEGGRTNKSESPLRVYVDNTATAINGITNNPVVKDEAYYNLQGVKVQRPQHGVFIHNGKKVVLK